MAWYIYWNCVFFLLLNYPQRLFTIDQSIYLVQLTPWLLGVLGIGLGLDLRFELKMRLGLGLGWNLTEYITDTIKLLTRCSVAFLLYLLECQLKRRSTKHLWWALKNLSYHSADARFMVQWQHRKIHFLFTSIYYFTYN